MTAGAKVAARDRRAGRGWPGRPETARPTTQTRPYRPVCNNTVENKRSNDAGAATAVDSPDYNNPDKNTGFGKVSGGKGWWRGGPAMRNAPGAGGGHVMRYAMGSGP